MHTENMSSMEAALCLKIHQIFLFKIEYHMCARVHVADGIKLKYLIERNMNAFAT